MWSDFDEAHGTLSLHRTFHIQKGGRVITGETKTGTEKRTITLPPSTAGLLTRRKKHACSQWAFPDPLRPEQPFHDLRHTFATHALASGVDAKTLAGILGHTKASFTLDTYTHVTGDMQRQVAQITNVFL